MDERVKMTDGEAENWKSGFPQCNLFATTILGEQSKC